jgi:hypothetical protein
MVVKFHCGVSEYKKKYILFIMDTMLKKYTSCDDIYWYVAVPKNNKRKKTKSDTIRGKLFGYEDNNERTGLTHSSAQNNFGPRSTEEQQ